MKTFTEIRKGKMPPGEHVHDEKFQGVSIMIHKQGSSFVAYVDGDKYDTFSNKNQAIKASQRIIKQLKAKK
jgi:hypothetical protein